MRQIKFRGHFPGDTKYFYGDLIQRDGYVYIRQGNGTVQVDPDSVAQFVGRDTTGREVYEGDVLLDELDCDWEARLTPTDLHGLTLKE